MSTVGIGRLVVPNLVMWSDGENGIRGLIVTDRSEKQSAGS